MKFGEHTTSDESSYAKLRSGDIFANVFGAPRLALSVELGKTSVVITFLENGRVSSFTSPRYVKKWVQRE